MSFSLLFGQVFTEALCLAESIGAEDRGSRDEYVCAGFQRKVDIVELDAAVDLDVCGQALLSDKCAGFSHFVKGLGHHFLAAEAGLDGHDQKHVNLVHVGGDVCERGLGFDGDSDLAVVLADLVDDSLGILGGLEVEGDEVSKMPSITSMCR